MEKIRKPTDTRLTKVEDKVSSVWKWISFPFKLIWFPVRICNWLRKHRKSAILVGIFALGLVMMFGASFRLHGAELITVLAVAGILMAFAYVKMTIDLAVKRGIKDQESQDLGRKKGKLVEELARVKSELDEERRKKVKVLNIRPILEMGILEAECEVTKCFDRYFDKDGQEIIQDAEVPPEQEDWMPREKARRFLGAITSKFRAKYGIDFRKVLVKCENEAKTIFVTGADPRFLGTRGYPEMRWEVSIGLRLNWLGDWVADADTRELELKCREKYRVAVEKSLENGPQQLEWVKEPLRRSIRGLLKIIIAPPDYRVVMVNRTGEGFVPLFKYMRRLGLEGPDQLLLP